MRLLISIMLAGLVFSFAPPAQAQSQSLVVSACGTLPLAYAPGAVRTDTIDVNGNKCTAGTITISGGATAANQVLQLTQETAINTLLGLQADSACATDNGTCTLAALVKRLNQRLTTLNTTLGSPLQAGGSIGNTGFTANAGTNLNTSALALDATVGTSNTNLGAPGATACATDTASCSLNALAQRLAQRLTTINTTLGTPFQAGGALAANQSVNVAQINGVAPLMGNGVTGTGAQRVTIASDNTAFSVNTIAGQTGVQGAAGVSTALTQRIAIATDANVVALPAAGTSVVGTKAAGTAAATSALVGVVYNSTAPTLTDGQQAAAQADSAGSHQVNTEGKKATYSAVAQITPAAGATNIFTITGSASKTVRVTRLQISGIATAASAVDVVIQLYSTAASGGTSTTKTAALHDSTSAAATAVVKAYTANPTAGTFNAFVRIQKITLSTAAGAIPIVPVSWDFTTRNSQGIVLRGTAQYLAIDWNAQTVTGNSVNIDAEWTEE